MDVANLGLRMGFPSAFRNVLFDYFSPTCKMYKINNEKAIDNVDFHPLLSILVLMSYDIIVVYVTSKLSVCKWT